MKKYYLQETAEEIKIGDMIELDLTKDLPNGNVKHYHLECKVIPELIPLLLEEGIIVKEKPKKEDVPSHEECTIEECIGTLLSDVKELHNHVNALEKWMKELSLLMAYTPVVKPVHRPKPKKNASKAGRE